MTQNPFEAQLRVARQILIRFYLELGYVPDEELLDFIGIFGSFPLSLPPSLPPTDAHLYVEDLTLTLVHPHELKIVDHHLRAENIVIEADGHFKLIDFGPASNIGDDKASDSRGSHH